MKSFLLCKIAVCALHPMRLKKHRRITPIFTFSRHFIFVDLNHFTKLVEFCFILFKFAACVFLIHLWHFCRMLTVGLEPTTVWVALLLLLALIVRSAFFIIKCSTSWTTSAHLLLLVYIIFKDISELSVLQTNTTFSRR